MTDILSALDAKIADVRSLREQLRGQAELLNQYQAKLSGVIDEQQLASLALQALQNIRPILAASASEQAVSLANLCLREVFQTEDTLFFSEEESRFFITTPSGPTDLVSANGGGYLAVISFIFSIFLVISQGNRRFFLYDEQFTMISDDALSRFIPFLRKLCHDIAIDMMFITHDGRISESDIDGLYYVKDGLVKKIK